MRDGEWRADLELACSAARLAGEIALRSFGQTHDVTLKTPDQPVTEIDLVIDRMLGTMLTAARPAYGWLSEETADDPDRLRRERVWIVDPIDGTRSFIAGSPEFTVSIGMADAGRSVVGVVYNPVRRELFSAVHGGGAYLEQGTTRVRLDVRSRSVHGRELLASSGDLDAGRLGACTAAWSIRAVGSTAYKLALVACGRADGFVTPAWRSEWDVCAGAILLGEAGGTVTDLAGGPLHYNLPRPELHGIIATAAEPAAVELRQAFAARGS